MWIIACGVVFIAAGSLGSSESLTTSELGSGVISCTVTVPSACTRNAAYTKGLHNNTGLLDF